MPGACVGQGKGCECCPLGILAVPLTVCDFEHGALWSEFLSGRGTEGTQAGALITEFMLRGLEQPHLPHVCFP